MIGRDGLMVLGLDSLDPDLVEQWAAEGELPALRRLYETAAQGRTGNPSGLVSGALWPSFHTGLPAGEHGQYDGVKRFDPSTYRDRHIGPEDIVAKPFWVRLSEAGHRVGVIDAPHCFLYPGLNGFQVVDWMTHLRVYDNAVARSTPPDLADTLVETFGDDPFPRGPRCPTDDADVDTPEGVRDFMERMRGRIRRKLDACLWLLEREPLDFFFVAFDAAHDTGHMLWHVHDRTSPHHRPDLLEACGDPLLEIYREIDAAVGRLLAAVGPDVASLVVLSHGIGRSVTASRTLDTVLSRLEAVYYPGDVAAARQSRNWRTVARSAWRRLPEPVRRQVGRATEEHRRSLRSDIVAQQRAARRMFEIYMFDSAGAVRINLKGREARGRVAPGAEYETLVRRLAEDLEALTNADTGEKLVEAIILADQIYPGPQRDCLPDLLIEWNRSERIDRVASPTLGVIDNPEIGVRSGDHRFEGAWFLNSSALGRVRRNQPVPNTAFAHEILDLFRVKDDPERPRLGLLSSGEASVV